MIDAARQAGVALRVYENFIFYPPHVRMKEMLDAGEIGTPQMIRLHVSTGKSATAWKVPLRAWLWRFQRRKAGGGPLVFDHGYHLFSLAHYLMGDVKRVYAWLDSSPVYPGVWRAAGLDPLPHWRDALHRAAPTVLGSEAPKDAHGT